MTHKIQGTRGDYFLMRGIKKGTSRGPILVARLVALSDLLVATLLRQAQYKLVAMR